MAEIPWVNILGVKVNILRVGELHERILHWVKTDQKSLILHVNVHGLNLSYEQSWLREFLNDADLVFCDGFGVIIGSRVLGARIPERITYADWTWQLAKFASENGISIFMLGGRPGIAAKAAENLHACFPTLRILGFHDGYFNKSTGCLENEAVLTQINTVHPDLLIVGFGMPLQEKWLMQNWAQIDARIGLTGGAVFDYISGELRRAPRWMTEHGLEWLGRLMIEPHRLWRRYLLGNPLFFWRVLKQRLGLVKFS